MILGLSLLLASSAYAANYDSLLNKFFTDRPYSNKSAYFGAVDEVTQVEQSAVSGLSYGINPNKIIVGFHGYGYGLVTNPWGVWGANFESTSAPEANNHLVGIEIGVYGRNGTCSWCVKRGLYMIFRNSAEAEPEGPGEFHNENATVMQIGATGASERHYSGFQSVISFDQTAMDRTVSKPYISIVDTSDLKVRKDTPLYLLVYKCGDDKCGLKVTENGQLEIYRDIDKGGILYTRF